MDSNYRGYQRTLEDDAGQTTVEYAVVTAAFMAMVVAAGTLWKGLSQGMFVDHALAAASHHIHGFIGWVVDIFSY